MIMALPPPCARGEIWMLDWAPGRGSEQMGYRPGVIVQCDEGNMAPGARTTILVPLTTRGRDFIFYVPVPAGASTGLREPSWANCTQVFTVDRARLKAKLGEVSPATLQAIGRSLMETLALV